MTAIPLGSQKTTRLHYQKLAPYLDRPLLKSTTTMTIDEMWAGLSDYLMWQGTQLIDSKFSLEYEPQFHTSLRLRQSLSIKFMSCWLSEYYSTSPATPFLFMQEDEHDIEAKLRRFCYEIGFISPPRLPRTKEHLHKGLSDLIQYAKEKNINHLIILSHTQRLFPPDISILNQWVKQLNHLEWIQVGSTHTKLPDCFSNLSSQLSYSPILVQGD